MNGPSIPPRPRILVAEDDPLSADVLQEMLQQIGCEVALFHDGSSALQQARENTFDLLLLDEHMPGLSGPEVLRHLHAASDPGAPICPALASSADLDTQRYNKLLAAGFVDVLVKPCAVEHLRGLLESCGVGLDPLDDAAAIQVAGSAHSRDALRRLLLRELDELADGLDARFHEQPSQLCERLHRLRSAAGFCGTPSLAQAAYELRNAINHDARAGQQALQRFRTAVNITRRALQASLSPPDGG